MAYIRQTNKYWGIAYAVMSKGRFGKDRARLVKEFYTKKEAEKYRDMLNGKIPRDEDWMMR